MISVDDNLCVGCALCVPFCPEDAISSYGLAQVSEDCTECLTCLEYCPVGALKETVLENGHK
jgi:NAD-dependent dihydropyrimidine dehydrogenase PreA subunit